MILINQKGQPFTFSGPRGENNIDVTLATPDIYKEISNWKVLDGLVTSDHRLIYFEIGKGGTYTSLSVKKRYITKKADWEKFDRELATQLALGKQSRKQDYFHHASHSQSL